MKITLTGVSVVVAVVLAVSATASANGLCGQDWNSASACPVNTATTTSYPGSLTTDNENDYYVFYASAGTEITATISDQNICPYPLGCSGIDMQLEDGQGNWLDEALSLPQNDAPAPATISHTLTASGTYYLLVKGDYGAGAPTLPYTLTVTASPNVQWPAPSAPAPTPTPTPAPAPAPAKVAPHPACKVPAFAHARLSTVKHRLSANHCRLGRVSYRHDKAPRNTVIAENHKPGKRLPYRSAINLTVSLGKRK